MLIDSHTHCFPPDIAKNRYHYVDIDPWFGELYRTPDVKIATVPDLLRSMDRSGIDVSVAVSFGWRDPSIGAQCAEYVLHEAQASDRRVLPLAYVQPSLGTRAAKQLERDLARGYVGVGELMPNGQGFLLDEHETLAPVLNVAAEAQVPVLIHVSEPVGHVYPGKGTVGVAAMWNLAMAFPLVRFIAAHWGGGLVFYELMPEAKHVLGNVWYDCAATSLLYRPSIFGTALQACDASKLLFASDYPVLQQRKLINTVRELGLPAESLKGLLGENARSLYLNPA